MVCFRGPENFSGGVWMSKDLYVCTYIDIYIYIYIYLNIHTSLAILEDMFGLSHRLW